ncbi:MAG TPA: BlaI/MecI/CopY family transcriptional regulator [Verrucomicrobiae bacterium]|nr:BlaI/MecI/CopY family transcriptional regulator [Verrucomicrobiae bacterium]
MTTVVVSIIVAAGNCMLAPKNIGQGELEVLQFIHDHHPATVRQVADHFAQSKGHVRTTVLNVMERLRKKGFLVRKKLGGSYQYSPKERKADFCNSMVGEFVQRALGGSVSPFVAYLVREAVLSKEEIQELKRLVAELDFQPRNKK